MFFVTVVPKDAVLHVVSGMEDWDASHSEVSHEKALQIATDWNVGKWHPDVWLQIFYKSKADYKLYECDLLIDDGNDAEVVGFAVKPE